MRSEFVVEKVEVEYICLIHRKVRVTCFLTVGEADGNSCRMALWSPEVLCRESMKAQVVYLWSV